MSEEKSNEAQDPNPADKASAEEPTSTQSGPTFTGSPDPLSGVRKAASDTWKSTEGKTVSLRVYLGSILGVIILMMLARCGGS
ncbi:MAG TPA: hypothetical protein VK854_06630 [Woeseiaceae bacterium]|nr:hypothetical protein [Woeseiaceae bacterium]